MRRRRERALLAASGHDLAHLVPGDGKVRFPRLLDRMAGRVFIDAIAQMLRHRMPGHERLVLRGKAEFVAPDQRGDRALDDPHPEPFRMDAGAVKVHQHGLHGPFDRGRVQRIIGRAAGQGADAAQHPVADGGEFRLAGAENRGEIHRVYPFFSGRAPSGAVVSPGTSVTLALTVSCI